MKHLFSLRIIIRNVIALLLLATSVSACSDDDVNRTSCPVTITDTYPEDIPATAVVKGGILTFTELNTGKVFTFSLPVETTPRLTEGIYNIEGNMTLAYNGTDGNNVEKSLRAVANQVVITSINTVANLKWFFFNPDNTLVFGEIYITGSLNAKGTSGLYDTFFTIYNNTDEVQYADGLAIVESKILNSDSHKILTEANDPENNFTVKTIYVIPGSGHDIAINPGQSLKIVDQAIDWNAQVAGALDHTDADFEWYDLSSSSSVVDTDNPSVPNLDKWYSYSPTIWIPNNQCLCSYALVRFPAGMTAQSFIAGNDGTYEYINAPTGTKMTATKCFLIKNEWIIDGVNFCNDEQWIKGALSVTVDMSYASISTMKADKNRFGKKFVRKVTGISAAGNKVLMDTNDSANDFELVSAR